MDLDKAINYFNEYTSHFKVADNKVTIKVKHTMGVVQIAEYIAKKLNLSEEDISDIYKGRSIVYVASCKKENK